MPCRLPGFFSNKEEITRKQAELKYFLSFFFEPHNFLLCLGISPNQSTCKTTILYTENKKRKLNKKICIHKWRSVNKGVLQRVVDIYSRKCSKSAYILTSRKAGKTLSKTCMLVSLCLTVSNHLSCAKTSNYSLKC